MQVVDGVAEIDDVGAFVADVDAVGDAHGVTVQAFDARYVVDRAHLERAVELAERARERGDTIADDFGVEILLYAAGRRQINRALQIGVSDGTCPVVAVVVGDSEADQRGTEGPSGSRTASLSDDGGTVSEGDEQAAAADLRDLLEQAETLGEYDADRVREFFDVSDTELAATEGTLADAVRERVALLVVEK